MTKKSIEPFIEVAINEATKSQMVKRYGAVVVHNNKIVGQGHNSHLRHLNLIGNKCGSLRIKGNY